MKRWPTVLLIASLVANLFLLAAIGGGMWRWHHNAGVGFGPGWRTHALDSLPKDKAEAFRAAMRGAVEGARPVIQQSHQARDEARRLFVAPQFDTAAVTAQMDRARSADNIVRARIERQVIAFAATLPQDQRAKLADALKRGPLRGDRPH